MAKVIVVYVHPFDRARREREIQAQRDAIEFPGSGLRVIGKPKVRQVWNRGGRYIDQPNRPLRVFRVVFQVEKTDGSV